MNLILFHAGEISKPLSKGDPRAVHLLKVLHKKEGGRFDAGIIGGRRGQGVITRVNADGSVALEFDLSEEPPPRIPVEVGVGFPRPIQLRRLLRDLSSAGVDRVALFGTELGEKSYRDTTLFAHGGAEAALIEGAAQARDTLLPRLDVFPSPAAWIESLAGCGRRRILADTEGAHGTFLELGASPAGFVIAIGSERGWSSGERALFAAAGFSARSLGGRALRTESAALAAAVIACAATQS